MSMWVVALDVFHAAREGLTWTGTDGYYIVDQMQYLSWIQSAAHHGLISNLFVLRSTPADYFQPAILISGAVAATGVPSWLALLLWKPVAVVALFLAMRAVANRMLPRRGAPARGARPGRGVRLVHGDLRRARDRRRHDAHLAVVGLSVRPALGRADHLRARAL